MKIKYVSIIILIVAASLTGCLERNKGTLRIDSLSFYGNEFFCNQKIKMWMCVESDNLYIAEYDWGCEAGHFTEKIFGEACWVAPNVPGEYDVWCKVTIGKNTETRHRTVNVSRYFFEYFTNGSVWTVPSTTTAARVLDPNVWMMLNVNSTTATTSYINYVFNDPNLKIPFSCRATMGHVTRMPKDSIAIGTGRAANTIAYQLLLNRDPGLTGLYIDQINFALYPVGSETNIMPIDETSGEKCNGWAMIRQAGVGAAVPYPAFFYHPALNFDEGENKKVSINVSEDYLLKIYVAGEKVFESDGIKTWRTVNNYSGSMHVSEWRIIVPNAQSGTAANVPQFFLDNTIADNTGITYTGAANELPNP